MSYAEFVRERYAIIILSTLLLALAVGLVTSKPGLIIKDFNVLLIAVMIGAMGFTMTFKSVRAAITKKGGPSIAFGLGLNFVFAPFICWIVAVLLLGDHPDFAVGLVLIGAVPCAGMALVWTGLLKGDLPMAAVINVMTMVIAPFVIPLIMLIFAGSFVNINVLNMFLQIMETVLVPLVIGMALRYVLEKRTAGGRPEPREAGMASGGNHRLKEVLPIIPAISATMAVLLMFMAINTTVPLVRNNADSVLTLIASTIMIFPILFVASYLIGARWLDRPRNIALTYSAGMKNLPIAIGIAAVSFGPLVMLPVAVAFAFQMMTAVAFYQLFRNFTPKIESA